MVTPLNGAFFGIIIMIVKESKRRELLDEAAQIAERIEGNLDKIVQGINKRRAG